MKYLQDMTISIIGQVRVGIESGRTVVDYGPDGVHVSAEIVRDEDDESVLLLQPIDHLLPVEHVLRPGRVLRRVIVIGRRFGVQATNVANLLQCLRKIQQSS